MIHSTGRYKLDDPNQRPLWPDLNISDVWPEAPHKGRLHLFVGRPAGMGSPTLVQMGVYFLRFFALAQDI